jgi:transposase
LIQYLRLTDTILSVPKERISMEHILGIDVSKDTLDLVLVQRLHRKVINELGGFQQIQQWLVSQHVDQVHACLEATGQYGDGVAEYLYEMKHFVSVVNPARIKRYGESKLHRNKNDKADAALIAEFCMKEKPACWKPISNNMKHLRALVRRLSDLQTSRQQERNRFGSGEKDEWVLSDLQSHIHYLDDCIHNTTKAIHQFIDQNASLKSQRDLLISIPGIGKLTAARLLAEIGDISSFENAPQLAAFAGLNPRGFSSGSSVHKKTKISKQGRAFLRCILFMPAIVAQKHNPVIHQFCARLSDRNLPKMAIVVASMRKLLHLCFGVLKNQIPFDPHYGDQFDFAS